MLATLRAWWRGRPRYRARTPMLTAAFVLALPAAPAAIFNLTTADPNMDRWMYPFNGTPGFRASASTFAAFGDPSFDERDGQFLLGFDTVAAGIPPGQGVGAYQVDGLTLRVTYVGLGTLPDTRICTIRPMTRTRRT